MPTISVPKDSHGRPNPFWDASGEDFLSARACVSSYSHNPSEGTDVRPVSNPSAHTLEQSCHTCRKPRYGNDKECVTEKHSFFFRQRLIHFIWRLSSTGPLLTCYHRSSVGSRQNVFLCQTGVWLLHPSLSPAEEKLTLFNHIPPPHTNTHLSFWMSVTPRLISLFPHASDCCQAQRGNREL